MSKGLLFPTAFFLTVGLSIAAVTPPAPPVRNQLRSALENLLKQKADLELQEKQTFDPQIAQKSEQINSLNDLLQQHRLTENDVSEGAANALRVQASATQANLEQIDQRLQILAGQIQQTQAAMNAVNASTDNYDVRGIQMENLKALLESQQLALQNLRMQKVNVTANDYQQTQAITSNAQTSKAALAANESAIQDQIAVLRGQLAQLQTQRDQTRLSTVALDDQIKLLEMRMSEASPSRK